MREPLARPARDATADFLRLHARVREEPAWVPEELRACALLVVPGIFTETYPFYLFKSRERLTALGLDLRDLPARTEAPVQEIGARIRDAVLAVAPRQTILIAHSKGPLDAHAALVLHPEIVPHVRALVSLQAPFGGTPLASDEGPALRRLVSLVLRGVFRASPQAFFDMSYAARQRFLREHGLHCPAPAISLVTTAARAAFPLELTRRYLARRYGAVSDGFVPADDACIPGSTLVRLEGVDHAGIALRWLGRSRFEPAPVMHALLALAVQQPAGRAMPEATP